MSVTIQIQFVPHHIQNLGSYIFVFIITVQPTHARANGTISVPITVGCAWIAVIVLTIVKQFFRFRIDLRISVVTVINGGCSISISVQFAPIVETDLVSSQAGSAFTAAAVITTPPSWTGGRTGRDTFSFLAKGISLTCVSFDPFETGKLHLLALEDGHVVFSA
jgi:hypothetical protein